MLKQQIAFIGYIHINPGYNSAWVETEQDGVFQIPDKTFINRALDGDQVVIMLLGSKNNVIEYAPWSLQNLNEDQQNNKQEIKTTYATVINVIKRKQQILTLDCILSASSSLQKQTIQLQPLNRLYPIIDCMNSCTQIIDRNQIIKVTFNVDDWLKQLANPPGEIISFGEKIEIKNLDQMAEFALSSAGINYNWKKQLSQDDEAYSLIQKLNKTFCEEVNLSNDEVFELQQSSLQNVDQIINRVRQTFDDANREDLMDQTVFTIDPDTAKDFDDACSVSVRLQDGSTKTAYEYCNLQEKPKIVSYIIGVHIADVTYFTDKAGENNILVRNAQQTTTSVYFADRCCPMYPYELADGLASLNPAVPRYVFSVIFEMDENAMLLPQTVKFTKGIIVSRCRLDYVTAQNILDNKDLEISDTGIDQWPICKAYHKSIIFSTKILNKLALKLRKQRESVGALQINNGEMRYQITPDMTVNIKQPEDASFAHHLIEEFMVVTNCLVSMRLMQTFPCCPVLRQHSPPCKEYPYNQQLKQLKCPPVDVKNPKKLIISLQQLATALQSHYQNLQYQQYQYQNLANTTFLSNSLVRAVYICGMSLNEVDLAHWGIHASSYMHFTSTIRRYADDVCHIMLNEALIWEKEAYSNQQYYNELQPHKLIFKNKINIYSNDEDFFPKGKLRNLSSKMFPVSENAEKNIQQENQNETILNDIVEGESNLLNFNLRENMKLKQKFQQLIKQAAQGENVENLYEKKKEKKDNNLFDENSEEYKLIKQINLRLQQRLKMPIQMIKVLMNRCNVMSQQTDNACKTHQQIVLNYYIQKLKDQQLITYCFLVKIDKQCIFYIPEYQIYFSVQNKDNIQKQIGDNGSACLTINNLEPLNKQITEGNKMFNPEFLKPIKIVIKPSKCPIDGVDICALFQQIEYQKDKQIIKIRNLCYDVPVTKKDKFLSKILYKVMKIDYQENKNYKRILNNINLDVNVGEFVGIIGSSGSGKSSLLNVINNKIYTKTYFGQINIDGQQAGPQTKKVAGYVMQEDILFPSNTPFEEVQFVQQLKMQTVSSQTINNILSFVGLSHVKNNYIAGSGIFKSSISGGEKRRVSLARELISGCKLLLCDEITSGLDLITANNICSLIRKITQLPYDYFDNQYSNNQPLTCVCTLHQPSSKVFAMLDRIIVMCKGEIVYNGRPLQFYKDMNNICLKVPQQYNPADYLIEIGVQQTNDFLLQQKLKHLMDNRVPETEINFQYPDIVENRIANREQLQFDRNQQSEHIEVNYKQETENQIKSQPAIIQDKEKQIKRFAPKPTLNEYYNQTRAKKHRNIIQQIYIQIYEVLNYKAKYRKNYLYQFLVLLERFQRFHLRNPTLYLRFSLQYTILALFAGSLYWRLDKDFNGIQTAVGALLLVQMSCCFTPANEAALRYFNNRQAYLREHSSGLYGTSLYYLAQIIVDFPIYFIACLVFSILTWFMVGFNDSFQRWLLTFLVLMFLLYSILSMVTAFTYSTSNYVNASVIVMVILTILVVFAGPQINVDSIPDYYKWMPWISMFAYSYKALMYIFLDGQKVQCFSSTCLITTTEQVYQYLGIEGYTLYSAVSYCFLFLGCWTFVFYILGYLGLRYKRFG